MLGFHRVADSRPDQAQGAPGHILLRFASVRARWPPSRLETLIHPPVAVVANVIGDVMRDSYAVLSWRAVTILRRMSPSAGGPVLSRLAARRVGNRAWPAVA